MTYKKCFKYGDCHRVCVVLFVVTAFLFVAEIFFAFIECIASNGCSDDKHGTTAMQY